MTDFSVGQSKVKLWRQCHAAYHWKYERELQRRRVKRPFTFGKIVHRMLEAKGQGQDPMVELERVGFENQKLFAAEREMYGDIVEDIRLIMTEYFDYHHDGLRLIPVYDDEGDARFTEHEFAVPMRELVDPYAIGRIAVDGIVFKGQVDGLGKTRNGLRWLVEHKTFDKLPNEDERWRSVQAIVYRRAAIHLGWVPSLDGVCWNYIRSKPPTVPKVLADGSRLSAAKVVTLPSVLRRVLRENRLSEESHAEQIAAAEASRDQYFHRIYTPVSHAVSDAVWSGFVESACRMRDSQGQLTDKNIGRHCSWCDYEPICRAELTGGDVDFVIQGEYTREDPEAYRRSSRDQEDEGASGGDASD